MKTTIFNSKGQFFCKLVSGQKYVGYLKRQRGMQGGLVGLWQNSLVYLFLF
jgi:hypothetical protein